MPDRRTFLAGRAAVLLAAPLAAEAQQGGKLREVDELHPEFASEERLAALREVGYAEGQNANRCVGVAAVERNHMPTPAVASNDPSPMDWTATLWVPLFLLVAAALLGVANVQSASYGGAFSQNCDPRMSCDSSRPDRRGFGKGRAARTL